MPFAMPMWPPIYLSPATRPAPAVTASPAAAGPALRRRWMIVDDSLRREVDEAEYRAALATCERVDVARYAHEDVITHLCYRART